MDGTRIEGFGQDKEMPLSLRNGPAWSPWGHHGQSGVGAIPVQEPCSLGSSQARALWARTEAWKKHAEHLALLYPALGL